MSRLVPSKRALRAFATHVLFAWCAVSNFACVEPTCADGFDLFGRSCTMDGPCGGCEPREVCDTTGTAPECRCEVGYEGDPCTFAEPPTLVGDPGFQRSLDSGPWEDDGRGAVVETEARDLVDPGKLKLDSSVLCSGGGVRQTIEMPSVRTGDPLVAEVTYRATDVHGLAVGFGRAWNRLPPTDDWETKRLCLGSAAHGENGGGGQVTVRIAAAERAAPCNLVPPAGLIEVDRFAIRLARAEECLPLDLAGVVLNGTAEPAAVDETWPAGADWDFLSEAGATARFAEDAGREFTTGVQLSRAAGSSARAVATTKLSVPATGHPALSYWWRGSPEALFEVKLGTRVSFDDLGRQVDTLVGSGSPNTFTYCLPPWTHGSVLDLTFSLRDEDVGDVELVVDEVRIVDVEDCGTSTDLIDPRFESSRSSPTRRMGTRLSSELESVAFEEAPGPSNGTENRVLALKSESTNTGLSVDTYVFVPGPDEQGPPAVRFYSRAPVSIASRVAWALGLDESMSDSVNADEQWDLNVVCLPELWAGRWYRLRVEMTGATAPQAIDTLLLDDLEVGTWPDCR